MPVTLELLVPGHTANAVLDFLLDTFVSRIMPHHLLERHDCGRPGHPTAPTVYGLRKEQVVPKEPWLINGALSILCVIVYISTENWLLY